MNRTTSVAIVGTAVSFAVVSLAVVGGVAVAAQDRSTLKVPNGLAFSEFKGYEDWQYVAVSQTATSVKVIAANPVMIERLSPRRAGQSPAISRGLQDREDRMAL